MRPLSALLLLFVTTAATASTGVRGIWYDRARDGHGLDSVEAGDIHFVVFYTCDAAGEPRRVIAKGAANGDWLDASWQSMRGYCRTCTPRAHIPIHGRVAPVPFNADPGPSAHREPTRAEPSLSRRPQGGRLERNTSLVRLSDTFAAARTAFTREVIDGNTRTGMPFMPGGAPWPLRLPASRPLTSSMCGGWCLKSGTGRLLELGRGRVDGGPRANLHRQLRR